MPSPIINDRFLRACRRQPVDRTPVWFMRQAGRYMAEYQAIRKKHSILEVCKNPELAAEVTLQPIERFSLDAAIIFADILLPLEPMGLDLAFVEEKGPVISNPVRDVDDVTRLKVVDGEAFGFSYDAVSLTIKQLGGRVPLIGFAGGPFTLASYAIEGGSTRSYITTKRMMFSQPKQWHTLLEKFSDVVTNYLLLQVYAGAQAIQLFDSWVGCLAPKDYEEYALPHVIRIIDRLRQENIPIIYFGTGTSTLLPLMKQAGSDVIGLDWQVELDEAWARLGYDVGVQGNLDPVVLYAPVEEIDRKVKDILERAGQRPGHIFNLGHGILPQTPVEHVDAAIASVHKYGGRET